MDENQVECVNATGSSSSCPSAYSESNPRNAFIAVLKISELTEDDQNHVHTLKIKNDLGETTYSVRIQTIEGNKTTKHYESFFVTFKILLEWPLDIVEISVGLTTGAIAGIVVGCILGVVLIAGAILMIIRFVNSNSTVF